MTNPTGARRSDLFTRAVVGLVLVGVALSAMWFGGFVFWLLAVLIALGMMREWAGLAGADAQQAQLMLFTLSVPLAIMCPLAAGPDFFALGLIAAAMFFAGIVTRRMTLALGMLYVGLPVLSLLLVRDQPRGLMLAFWMLGLVWLCDIGAYFAGRTIGGARLAPVISPNKTWAGLIGGVAAASVFGAAMHIGYGLPWRLTLATPVLALMAQFGDLFESWLKRRAGVKDSGNLLPGHGGLLDRLDGVVPVAPAAAALVMLPQVQALLLQGLMR
ncbi:MAG: phosphatidate cytidylyltransferase [Sphingomonas sp.]|nr:phosphatidate cytidylyltransferase [Sphingomonas sp.]